MVLTRFTKYRRWSLYISRSVCVARGSHSSPHHASVPLRLGTGRVAAQEPQAGAQRGGGHRSRRRREAILADGLQRRKIAKQGKTEHDSRCRDCGTDPVSVEVRLGARRGRPRDVPIHRQPVVLHGQNQVDSARARLRGDAAPRRVSTAPLCSVALKRDAPASSCIHSPRAKEHALWLRLVAPQPGTRAAGCKQCASSQ